MLIVGRKDSQDKLDGNLTKVSSQLEASDALVLLELASDQLFSQLNIGNFEGASGANP